MVVLPAAMPVTIPVLPTVAALVLLLLHTPLVAVLFSVVVEASQTWLVPVTVPALGSGLTVTKVVVLVVMHLFDCTKDIVAVPAVIPDTIPVLLPTLATDGLVLFHTPVWPALARVVVAVAHTTGVPVMLPGVSNRSTVIVFVDEQLPKV